MLSLCLVLILSASVFSESQARETETWVPMKTTQTVAMSTRHGDLESSGDSPNGSDFGFTDGEDNKNGDDSDSDYYTETLYDDEDEDEYDGFSGSGDGATTMSPVTESKPSVTPDVNDNNIPGAERPVRPTVNEVDIVRKSNEIPLLSNEAVLGEEQSNVLMAHAGEDSIFNKTEVLAALIAGGAVGLMFAILLILLLIYRMKKKDEGSYDLGKKPIYKKAPTTEIYA
ncbi:syndecan-4 isoform X1 [Sander lucioperca]|uniref:syndecan-4 isoform X1 n=1 Tax=Sander lucioperca TaxID=283035 RepID=UPI00125D1B67|nr:syndecan-4 isoform X1 [Sander lucioperca]